MSSAVTRKKINLPPMHAAADDRIGRIAERRLDPLLRGILDALHLVKTASADDPNGWRVFTHSRAIKLQPLRQRKPAPPPARRYVGAGARFVSQSALRMPKFFIKTYGCQMNERDSEQVAHSLL